MSVSVISKGENDITEGLIFLLRELTFNDAVWNYYNEPYLMVFFVLAPECRDFVLALVHRRRPH